MYEDGFGFSGFQMMFSIIFFLIVAIIIVSIVRGLMQWNKNNHSPRLSVEANVVSKRIHVSHDTHMHNDHAMHSSTTFYYVTFQVESGDRMEFHVSGTEYGMLAEGDYGKLTFQGTRYLGFERQ